MNELENELKRKAIFKNLEGPRSVAFTITNKCNLRCLHCFNNSEVCKDTDLSDEELINIAKQITEFELSVVCLCGGEPLIRTVVFELISILKKSTQSVNMVSNGLLLTDEIARKIKK